MKCSPINVLIDEGRSAVGKPTGIRLQAINLHKHLKKYCNCKISNYEALKILPKGIKIRHGCLKEYSSLVSKI